MTILAFNRINFAGVLAATALIFLFLVVLGLGRPAFAADYISEKGGPETQRSSCAAFQSQELSATVG